MKNLEIAKIFYEVADILEIKGVDWKPQAYRKAARALETLSEDVEVLERENKLEDIQGVGKNLANKISEYIHTGKIKEYIQLKKELPKHISELLEIPGIGPKRTKILYQKLKIKSMKELEKAAKSHKIRNLEGFDEVMEKNILDNISFVKKGEKRELLGVILPLAENIKENLESLKEVKRVEVAGSLRRRKETIGDVDILAISSNPKQIMKYFVNMDDVKKVLAEGNTKASILLKNSIQVDLRILEERSFGSGLLYFTGNKDHNIVLRNIAIKKGYKLSEYGLFKGDKLIAGKTEEEVYSKLGMSYIPPEIRENIGEVDLALKNKIPKLVELKDIKGDMHVHTNYSEGSCSLKEAAEAAIKKGYMFVNITDHAKRIPIANGMSERKMLKQISEIDKLNKKFNNFKILKGVELNIDSKGGVDFNNKILKELDFAIAGVHSRFKMDKQEMTKRIINTMENEYVKIIAHPTGRLINKREGYELDLDKIFDAALRTGTILEIDGTPSRLDLNDSSIREAVKRKVKLSIGSDAHSIEQMRFLEYGVYNARRGCATSKDIVNCADLRKFK